MGVILLLSSTPLYGNPFNESKSWEPEGPVQQVYDLDVITHAAEIILKNLKFRVKLADWADFRQIKNCLCTVNMGFLFIHQK
jgi:hypothetical protein